ncbi:hypothetical protein EXIGLDRAFT_764402 [Exidia glandulosa HHB12029]|uniref:VTT domain-containing protein n=1 Tax=Exidia glandulosa HHB12029 TaxID=1314781 RepID=A0A165L6X7_EXIGL|nr:hypothetical protein EXIGLDRAFT_764402 [Exidia glandulosa HHB12029]
MSSTSSPSSSRSTTPRPRQRELQLEPTPTPTSPIGAAAALHPDPAPLSPTFLGHRSSTYTLHSISEPAVDASPAVADTRLLAGSSRQASYGAIPPEDDELVVGRTPWHRRPLVQAAFKVALIFAVSGLILGGALWLALPRIKPEDRHLLHIPRNFEDLQGLNTLMKRYRKRTPFRIVICWMATYLFVQAFCVPGSMYLSILGGAMWGVPLTVPLVCLCVAFGSTLCYSLSAAFGPALLAVPKWRTRIEAFGDKVEAQRANLFSYMVILRISPVPHWLTNLVSPHVRIGVSLFWITSFVGAVPLAVIHATIGGGLEQMTSPDDFHLFSLKNLGLLTFAVLAALVPVLVRRLNPAAEGDALRVQDVAKRTAGDDRAV